MERGMNTIRSGIALDTTEEVEVFRARLRRIIDKDLVQYGKDCAFLCSRQQNFGKRPLPVWTMQLREARAEWRRRHPKK
jgi:hypothetical protein